MEAKVDIVYGVDLSTGFEQRLFEAGVSAGFPSPAGDYEEGRLDLNRHLIRNPAATFFVRVRGDSMVGAGVHHGDLLVVDRSVEAVDKNVVIAAVNGELTVKRIRIKGRKISLEPENENYPPQQITEETEFEVWGVVTNVVHTL